jgi:uncharacterized protein (DUF849 family)
VPVTPLQIADAAAQAANAGAAMVHIHVRDPNTGLEATDKQLFIEVVDRIRQQGTDVIINLTTGIGATVVFDAADPSRLDPAQTDFWTPERRVEHIAAARPDVCSLDVPIMNFNDYAFCCLPDHIRVMAKLIRALGVKPEIECFDLGDLWSTQRFVDEGLFEAPTIVQLCMGIRYGAPATARALLAMLDLLPPGAVWGAFGVGDQQFPMVAQAALLGGNVRVGLEDNLFLAKGVPATNGQLVERAASILHDLGTRHATTAEARHILGLDRVAATSPVSP